MEVPAGHKKCSACCTVKPFSDFGKESKGRFGLKSKCKVCISVKNKSYAAGDGAEIKKRNNAAYQSEHREELLEKAKIVREKKKFGDRYDDMMILRKKRNEKNA
ncbi:hypothetical protein RRS04_004900 [Klebsiella aerogenes]|nr:hypothetical protein [Klebsiella aerogenes]